MKKYLIICTSLLVILFGYNYITKSTSFIFDSKINDKPNYNFTTNNKNIYKISDGKEELFEIKGVDMGAGIPGHFATEFAITYEMYLEWFKLIQEMNANVIRVYTISDPTFYHAFYDYNKNNSDPLYLIHGVWVDDEENNGAYDAYVDNFIDVFKNDCQKLVDVLHGNRNIQFNSRHGYGKYKWDVSKWTLGYILGIEWDQHVVMYTNDVRDYMSKYNGTFLYTDDDATAFEAMLARVGDCLLEYEMKKYGDQKLLAFSNWPETDPLMHDVVLADKNPLSRVDVEHIHSKNNLKSGMFASYHIYPYFPPFYEFETKYSEWLDVDGKRNPYKAYLTDINNHHSIPVVISEFGLPSSRGITHKDSVRGMNQGNLSEKEQGERLKVLYKDIKDSGCAGALIFVWQDEWFKRTWNTMAGVNLARTAYWSDYQTNEQMFGLITFDPGKEKSIVYVDGDVSEWDDIKWLYKDEKIGIKATYDERFVYFNTYVNNMNDDDIIYIPVDITPNSGAFKDDESGLSFYRMVDFLIRIDGKDNSVMLVQEYYDMLYATERRSIWKEDAFINPPNKDSHKFNLIQLFLRRDMEFENGIKVGQWLFPTGKLIHGDANPDHENFNSIADYCINGDNVEIRIPWTMFNFSDPSQMEIHDDYYKYYGVEEMPIDKMYISMELIRNEDVIETPFKKLKLNGWGNNPTWHMRIKESYYAMQEAFKEGW